jgi:hypothetical protein
MYLILQQLTAETFVMYEVDVMIKICILTLTRVRPSSYIISAEFISTQKFKKACELFSKGKNPFLLKNKKR